MRVFEDILAFFRALNINDVIFFSAILALIILVISMIYFLRVNKAEHGKVVVTPEEKKSKKIVTPEKTVVKVEKSVTDDFSAELLKEVGSEDDCPKDTLPKADDEDTAVIDLEAITRNLSEQKMDVDLTKYEAEQEEKAIISYDELLQNADRLKLNYSSEIDDDGVLVKQVDLDNLTVPNDEKVGVPEVNLFNYEKEEMFLKTLKDLGKILG